MSGNEGNSVMGHGVVGLGSTGSIGSTGELSVLPHPVAHSCAAQTSKAIDRVRGDRRVLGDRSEGTGRIRNLRIAYLRTGVKRGDVRWPAPS